MVPPITRAHTEGASKQSLACRTKRAYARRRRPTAALSDGKEEALLPSKHLRTTEAKCCRSTNEPTSGFGIPPATGVDDLKSKTGSPSNWRRKNADGASPEASATSGRRVLALPVPKGFDFSMAICSYGFFCMMPNEWIPPRLPQLATSKATGSESTSNDKVLQEHGVLRRPLRYGERARRCCLAQITCREPSSLQITLEGDVPANDAEADEILGQVKRMCRLDDSAFRGYSIEQFWLLHPEAKARGFGYLFRSPTVWEDMVKTITICNVRWSQSLTMNRLLCTVASSVPGSFPTPWDVVRFSPAELQQRCGLGYRGERVRRLADSIINGTLDIHFFDTYQCKAVVPAGVSDNPPLRPSGSASGAKLLRKARRAGGADVDTRQAAQNVVMKKLLSIYGFGKFAAENMMQLLGFFEVHAFDSETIRHMREVHGFSNKDKNRVLDAARRRLEPYRPFQFLAYWFELWKMYEAQVGLPSPFWTSQNSFFVAGRQVAAGR